MSWRRIPLKYPGKCTVCGGAIPVGSQVMWLKGTGVRHQECAEARELACIVCGSPAGCPSCEFAEDCDLEKVSQACVCSACASKPGAFGKYREAAAGPPGRGAPGQGRL